MISKATIRAWLDNYEGLDSGCVAFDDLPPCNSGPKEYDGVGGLRLNKIMLDAAIERLPEQLKKVVYYRWINKRPLAEVLNKLKLGQSWYYQLCDKAVKLIWEDVNGRAVNVQAFQMAVGPAVTAVKPSAAPKPVRFLDAINKGIL
jgi:hypothetical protein